MPNEKLGQLDNAIRSAVELERQITEMECALKMLRESIKSTLLLKSLRQYHVGGSDEGMMGAALVRERMLTWRKKDLRKILSTDMYRALCPRKVDTKRVRELLTTLQEADGEDEQDTARALLECATTQEQLFLRFDDPQKCYVDVDETELPRTPDGAFIVSE